jgi:hypothetical protein
MPKRYYTTPDGTRFPLIEAKWDMSFRCYKSDRRKAVPGNPHECLLAIGIKRDRRVLDAYLGSGQDAYVVFKADDEDPAHAVHFTIPTVARRAIDQFDTNRKAATVVITLRRPTGKRTLEARKGLNKDRRERIKNGAHRSRSRTQTPRQPRITRLGVHHRPRPRISSAGNVNVSEEK